MGTTTLLFGIHMHQPVDNFAEVIEHAIDICYGPFFEVMSRYPEFRFSVHCSGWLMEQIALRHPELYRRIQTMAEAGTIELVSAGYYEPILSAIPSDDRMDQILKLNDSIAERFGQTPQGAWLTERVWEPSLIPDLVRCGIRYTVMDDYHFQCAGFDERRLDGYYLSEEGGERIALFPISKKLRYALPFHTVERALSAIRSYGEHDDSAAVIFDDAEKFGMWPGTYEWVYTKGWLERFVRSVIADPSIRTLQYREYLAEHRPRGIAYLPNVSYYEMGEWSLGADDALKLEGFREAMGERFETEGIKFLKGGIWKNFFVKYPESNRLHKRMLELSRERDTVADARYDDALFRLQTNDPLWHGVFGGLYLPNLRDNAYRYLIEGENLRYEEETFAIVTDQNELDGYDKIKALTPELLLRFDAGYGGQLVEFDARDEHFNWQNTLTRRKEAYHRKLFEPAHENAPQSADAEEGIDTIHTAAAAVDERLKEAVVYDWYLKNSFIDHITDASFSRERFYRCNFREYGDFANQPFESGTEGSEIRFARSGGLYFPEKADARLEKRFRPKRSGLGFDVSLSTAAEGEFCYVLELNLHFADYAGLRINGRRPDEETETVADAVEIVDDYLGKKIGVRCDRPFTLSHFLLRTLSQNERGFELSEQGVSIALAFPFSRNLRIEGEMEVSDV